MIYVYFYSYTYIYIYLENYFAWSKLHKEVTTHTQAIPKNCPDKEPESRNVAIFVCFEGEGTKELEIREPQHIPGAYARHPRSPPNERNSFI